jgi:endoglucanase
MGRHRWIAWLIGAAAACALVAGVAWAAREPATAASACGQSFPATRDPANPLLLSSAPGADPLSGASFFVDGPGHGAAAGAIAQLLGLGSSFSDSESWAQFHVRVTSLLKRDRSVAHAVGLLEKIASEPEPQRFSSFSAGGGPGAILGQVRKVLCNNGEADPTAIPILTTYFLHASLKGCPSAGEINAYMPTFERRIGELVTGIGRRPVVLLLELDGIGSSQCIAQSGGLSAWEAALRYEVDATASLPHAVVYVEAGYSDGNSPAYTARVLNAINIHRIRGFFTNDTHLNWTSNEIKWGDAVSRMTGGADFVIDTANNGDGPLRNSSRKLGIENLCNPPGRALGPRPTTSTGFAHVDAFLWTHVPGVSAGCGGGPPGSVFWPPYAEGLAARANGRLGPGYPSRPY